MSKTSGATGAPKKRRVFRKSRRHWRRALPATGTLCALTFATPAHAIHLYNGPGLGGNNLEISLNITASYSNFYRVNDPSAVLTSPNTSFNGNTGYNSNEGDINFRHGFVGNIFEVLPVLDIKNGNYGAHFSGEYFINTVYLQGNQNNQPDTVNPVTASSNTSFATETRTADGQNGRLLDAFVYARIPFGNDQVFTVKAGQQTLLWGQSLFFGQNGIAGGQAPIDVISAQNLVNPQSQQIFLPVGQVVLTWQPNDTYTIQGYYQYQWEPDSLQGVGSYFSTTDLVGPGGQRIIAVAGATAADNIYLFSTKALTPPSQNGQFGLSLQAQWGNYDVGIYGLRYDAKTPTVYTDLGNLTSTANGTSLGTYREVYPRDIQLYGASVSTTIGTTNVAGELSTHRNMPLVGTAASYSGANDPYNANSNPAYPVGNTLTGLTSFIYGSPALAIDPGGITVDAEVEYVQLLNVTANRAALVPGRSPAAAAFDVQVSPAYFDVLIPNLELQFPVSLSYDFAGNSQVDGTMSHGTGSVTVGVQATYRSTWMASLNYVDFIGKPGLQYQPNTNPNADRGYVTFNIQHTF